MTTRAPLPSSTESFDDEDDRSCDFGDALEAHLLESVVFTGDDATWIDAPVAMVEEGDEPETIALDSAADFDSFDIPVDLESTESVKPSDAPGREEASDPFSSWLRALVDAAESAHVLISLEALRSFVSEGRVLRHAFPSGAATTLAETGIARVEGDELLATAAFLRVVAEWRRVLVGDGGDFSKCGSRTFDEWSADFIARIVGAPTKFDWLKSELRRRGVAAFGLVENAA